MPPMTLPPTAPVVVIYESPGGIVEEYEARILDYKQHHVKVIVDGPCASACTLVLTVDDVCVTPNARFGFHQAFYMFPSSEPGDTSFRADSTTREIFQQYPKKLQRWISQHGGLGPNLIVLKDRELTDMFPVCELTVK